MSSIRQTAYKHGYFSTIIHRDAESYVRLATMTESSLGDLLPVFKREAKQRMLTLTALFSGVALVMLVVALAIPKRFEASTLLFAEASNIIKPLMEGRAVTTGVADQVAISTQVVMSRRILREILVFGGWVNAPPAKQPDPLTEEKLLNQLRIRIKIESQHEQMIRITYNDTDPKRAFMVTNRLAEIYIREATEDKVRESREAFEFIDKQVKEYGAKLTQEHEKVLAQARGEGGATPLSAEPISPTPPSSSRVPAEQLAALRSEEAALLAQLPHKLEHPAADSQREKEQLRARVAQLKSELDRLLVAYTEEHPEVKRVRRELAVAEDRVSEARLADDNLLAGDDEVTRAITAEIKEVRRKIASAGGSVRRAPAEHRPELAEARSDPGLKSVGQNTTLSELLRRYEATRDVYQDLLKRRENARVSMEIDAQHRGFTFRVEEPAEIPITASGLRLMHLTLAGLIFAMVVPMGYLFVLVRLDARVRSPLQIERLARVPLLGSISYSSERHDKSRYRYRQFLSALMVVCVLAAYITAFVIKLRRTS